MPEPQFKRNIAYKLRIESILNGNPVIENEKFSFLDFDGKKVVRVNVVASVVDKYDVDDERKYVFLTIDDGSGQIKVKAFGDESEKIRKLSHGQTIAIIGTLRYFNNEIYISPEAVSEQDPKYLILRKLETEKQSLNKSAVPEKPHDLGGRIIELIKDSEKDGGIDIETLNSKLSNIPKEKINEEIQKLLEEGMAFEPKPGKIRWLG